MKKIILMSLVMTTTLINQSFATQKPNKVIYGADERVLAELEPNQALSELARSTAGMIPDSKCAVDAGNGSIKISGTPLKDTFNKVCADEKFADSITAPVCSGFLVGKDLLVTAGHCIKSLSDCSTNTWVFGFRQAKASTNTEFIADKDQAYKCTEIISRQLNNTSKNDYALVRLDREVVGRNPLKFRTEGEIKVSTELAVIGHPSGLPSIIGTGAKVRNNKSKWFFQANLDTFGGNSGSAVFNTETMEVEGILVRGEVDYKMDVAAGCKRVYKCENDKCRGEDVTRITVIPELVPGMTPEEPLDSTTNWGNIFEGLDLPFNI